jgi:hypothetical protein
VRTFCGKLLAQVLCILLRLVGGGLEGASATVSALDGSLKLDIGLDLV